MTAPLSTETVSWWRRLIGLGHKPPHAHEWERNMAWRYGALLWECKCGAKKWYSRQDGYQIKEPSNG